jgi:manganese/iron transport system permease protein
MLAVATGVAVLSSLAGIYISFLIDSAPAPTIVVIMTGLFIAAFVRTIMLQARTGVRPA